MFDSLALGVWRDGNNGSPKTVLHCLARMGSGTSVQGKCCSYTGLR